MIYLIKQGNHYKIGRSKNVKSRLNNLQVGNPKTMQLVGLINYVDDVTYEKQLHKRFNEFRIRGEWFKLPTHKEHELLLLFSEHHDIVIYIEGWLDCGMDYINDVQRETNLSNENWLRSTYITRLRYCLNGLKPMIKKIGAINLMRKYTYLNTFYKCKKKEYENWYLYTVGEDKQWGDILNDDKHMI